MIEMVGFAGATSAAIGLIIFLWAMMFTDDMHTSDTMGKGLGLIIIGLVLLYIFEVLA